MGAGRIVHVDDDAIVPIAEGLVAPIGLRMLPDGALLIAEFVDSARPVT